MTSGTKSQTPAARVQELEHRLAGLRTEAEGARQAEGAAVDASARAAATGAPDEERARLRTDVDSHAARRRELASAIALLEAELQPATDEAQRSAIAETAAAAAEARETYRSTVAELETLVFKLAKAKIEPAVAAMYAARDRAAQLHAEAARLARQTQQDSPFEPAITLPRVDALARPGENWSATADERAAFFQVIRTLARYGAAS